MTALWEKTKGPTIMMVWRSSCVVNSQYEIIFEDLGLTSNPQSAR